MMRNEEKNKIGEDGEIKERTSILEEGKIKITFIGNHLLQN